MNAPKPNTGIIDIHGKQYQTVALRVGNFRQDHPDWTLKTSIIHRDEVCVVMLAEIMDEHGRLIATGHSEEFRSASSINKTSALENSETSAIGRALAALGKGGTEFCSADELVNALKNKQPAPVVQPMRHNPREIAWNETDPEEQDFMLGVFNDLKKQYAAHGDAEKIVDFIEAQLFDNDQRMAFQHLLAQAKTDAGTKLVTQIDRIETARAKAKLAAAKDPSLAGVM